LAFRQTCLAASHAPIAPRTISNASRLPRARSDHRLLLPGFQGSRSRRGHGRPPRAPPAAGADPQRAVPPTPPPAGRAQAPTPLAWFLSGNQLRAQSLEEPATAGRLPARSPEFWAKRPRGGSTLIQANPPCALGSRRPRWVPTCTHTHTRTRTHTCARLHARAHTHARTRTHVCTPWRTDTPARAHALTHSGL
jgi:hypothetical protein